MDDKELEYARAERNRALNPSAYDKGFSEGDDTVGFGSGDDWGSWGNESSSGGDSGFGDFGSFGGDSSFGGGGGFGDSGFGGGFGDSGGFGGGSFGGGGGSFGGGGGFGGGFGSFGGGFGGTQPPAQNNQNTKELEDAVFDGIVKGGKTAFDATKKIGVAAKTFDIFKVRAMGKQMLVTGVLSLVIGIIIAITGVSIGLQLVIGGLLTASFGVISFMVAHDKISAGGLVEPVTQQPSVVQPKPELSLNTNDWGNSSNDNNSDWGSSDSSWDDADSGWDDADSSWDDADSDWDDADSSSDNSFGGSSSSSFSFDSSDDTSSSGGSSGFSFEDEFANGESSEDVLDSVEITNGTVTRQYIYEKLTKVLPNCNEKFNKVEELSESGIEFGDWLVFLNKATDVLKPGADSKEKKPQLISVKKKLFYFLLEVSVVGVKGIKPDALTEQLVALYAYDAKTNKRNNDVYGTYDSVGGTYYIKIMRGESTTVSIKDIMEVEKKFFLDTKNEMPCALGIDIDGEPIVVDAASFDTLLVTGEPRSGKSWCTKNILLQMLAFSSPDELNLYIFDPKAGISDYNKLKAPHIKRFETTDAAIVNGLREVVRVEGPRRKQLLAEAGVYKIQEYRDKYPTENFPYLYVIIDEVVTLAERMDKETKAEFQSLLTELVTQLPATGIRLFMIPHVVKDDIIKKTTTQNIPCRISVRGNPEHIELCTGLKPKDFKYKLNNIGDMAVNVKTKSGILQTFVHSSVVAANSDKSDECFNFVDGLWRKINNLSPDEDFRVSTRVEQPSSTGGIKLSKASSATTTAKAKSSKVAKQPLSNDFEPEPTVTSAPVQEAFSYTTQDVFEPADDDTGVDIDIW